MSMEDKRPLAFVFDHTILKNPAVSRLVHALRFHDVSAVIVCCQEEQYRDRVESTLQLNGINFDALYMRPERDQQPNISLYSWMIEHLILPNYEVLGVFDRNRHTAPVWGAHGLTCFHTDPGCLY